MNRGNAWGAKGPYCCHVEFSEGDDPLVGAKPTQYGERTSGLPKVIFKLKKRLCISSEAGAAGVGGGTWWPLTTARREWTVFVFRT